MTSGNLHNCENPRSGEGAPESPFDEGHVAPLVMVTPVRQAEGRITYQKQIQHLHKLCEWPQQASKQAKKR